MTIQFLYLSLKILKTKVNTLGMYLKYLYNILFDTHYKIVLGKYPFSNEIISLVRQLDYASDILFNIYCIGIGR